MDSTVARNTVNDKSYWRPNDAPEIPVTALLAQRAALEDADSKVLTEQEWIEGQYDNDEERHGSWTRGHREPTNRPTWRVCGRWL